MKNGFYRLVTRGDFDGLAAAVLFRELNVINAVSFVNPKDVQDGKVKISERDITTNLPYNSKALLVFDHHSSEVLRVPGEVENRIIDPSAPSAARVVWESLGGRKRFTEIHEEFMRAVDKADSANFTFDEVVNPKGWALLNFIIDPRTGIGRYHKFRIDNQKLMLDLIKYCRTMPIEQILEQPDVRERIDLYNSERSKFNEQIRNCTRVEGALGIADLRQEKRIHVGNRFMIYALFPEIKASMHVMWGKDRKTVVLAVGKSIFNRNSELDIGKLMLEYGGGGHRSAGTCQIKTAEFDEKIKLITDQIKAKL